MALSMFLLFEGNKELSKLRAILNAGRQPNLIDAQGNSPLHDAVSDREIGVIRFLLKHGTDIDIRNDKYETPLHVALGDCLYRTEKIVDLLLGAGADPNAIDATGATPMEVAVRRNWASVIPTLVAKGATLASFSGSVPPLVYAARYSTFEVVQALLRVGADPNCADDEHYSPLHNAAKKGNFRMVQALIEAGADPYATNAEGKTALDLATVPPVQMILREAMAKGEK